ncbi:MAG: TackOD1 domain-containing metal-binding protein [Xanthobacteraceae bacterium]
MLGGTAPEVSGLHLLNLEGGVGGDCDGIILLKHIELGELADVLLRAPDPAVPIADFFDNHPVRRDFIGSLLNDASAKEMLNVFAPIWYRLNELPYRAHAEDRTGIIILRLAYSRNAPVEAVFNARYPLTVQYPLVGTGPGIRQHLEFLANQDLLRRRHFTRTHACGKCASARLNIYEACLACGSSNLFEEVLVHHYRCGCQEAESHFVQGGLLICPKCRRELRHLGVDYGKPGKIVECRACGAVNSEPTVNFICMDCSAVTPADDAAATDWYHYDLTTLGLDSLREGRLPQSEFDPTLEQSPRAYSPREFGLLALQEKRVARQTSQAFSVARISFLNLEAIRHEYGAQAAEAAFRHAVDAIVKAVRESDFVGIASSSSVVVGFPGLKPADVRPIEDRIQKIIRDTIESSLEIAVEIAEGDAVVAMIARG